MGKQAQVSQFLRHLGSVSEEVPDKRAGHHNQQYEMADAVLGGFSVFFTQSESFLAHQRDMTRRHGRNNLVSVFGARHIPRENHIRDLLDGVPASSFEPCYERLWSELEREEQLDDYRTLGGRLLVGIDGIQSFSSTKIHCAQCTRTQVEGTTRYRHRALTALVVYPEQHEVLALMPEIIAPQDGAEKQDCELAAAKRWLSKQAAWLQEQEAILLGDDLFSLQPFCEMVVEAELAFILVCKPASHKLLYQWIEGMEEGGTLNEIVQRKWNGATARYGACSAGLIPAAATAQAAASLCTNAPEYCSQFSHTPTFRIAGS